MPLAEPTHSSSGDARARRARELARRRARLRALAAKAREERAAAVRSQAQGQGRRETQAHGRETHRGGAKLARRIELGQALMASVAKGSKVVGGRAVRIQPPKGRSPLEGILSKNTQTSGFSDLGGALAALRGAGGLTKRATDQIGESIIYSPAGVYEAGKATGLDTRDIVTGRDRTPTRTKDLATLIASQVKEDFRHPLRNIGYLGMDVFAGLSGGAGATSRLGAAGRAAAAGKGAGRARAALTRAPGEGGSLLRGPRPGRAELAAGASVPLSRNALVRGFQRKAIKAQKERPESKIAGFMPGRTLHGRVGFERRRGEQIMADADRAAAEGLRARGHKATDVVNRAVQVVGERTPIAQRLARHEYAAVEGNSPRALLARNRLKSEIALLGDVERSGLVVDVNGVPRPTERLRELYERSLSSTGRREGIVEELGLMSRKQMEARRAAPARVFEGAEFIKTPARKGRVAQTREYAKPGRTETRPRTAEQAQERLAKLDAEYEAYVRQAEELLSGGAKLDPADVGRRNMENRRRGRGLKKQKPLPTLKQELRAEAEAELYRVADKHPDQPSVRRFLALDRERSKLRDVLNDPERAFGTRRTETGAFGETTYTVPGKTIRRTFKAQEPRRASTRLVGAEGTPPGELFVSYARRRPRVGPAQMGTTSGMGLGAKAVFARRRRNQPEIERLTPKAKAVLHGKFTGESIAQGRVPRNVVERIAEDELEVVRLQSQLRVRAAAVKESIGPEELAALPSNVREHYRPVRVKGQPYSPETRDLLDSLQQKIDAGQELTKKERETLADRAETVRSFFFPHREMDVNQVAAAAARGEVRFYDRRRLGKLDEPQTAITPVGKKLTTFMDEFNSAKDVADLFLRPGYGPANFLQQVVSTAAAGVGPLDIALALKLKRSLTPEAKAKIRGGAGLGFARSMPRERGQYVRPTRNRLAYLWGKVLDDPFRWTVFVKHARDAGYNTPAKFEQLLAGRVDDFVEVSKRTRDDLLDYDRMGPSERKILARAIRFYPFLKASGVYTGHFFKDHPVLAALVIQHGRLAKEKADKELGPLPFYRRGLFKVGGTKEKPLVVDPRAAQVFESPIQAGQLGLALATGITGPLGLTDPAEAKAYRKQLVLGDLVSPAVQLGRDLLDPRNKFTGEELTFGEALRENLGKPSQERVIRSFLGEPDPEDEADRQLPSSPAIERGRFLAGGIFPRPVNRKALNEAAAEEGLALLNPRQRAYRKIQTERQAFYTAAKRHYPDALENGRLPKSLRTAFIRKAAREAARADLEAREGDPTQHDRYETDVKLLRSWGLVTPAEVAEAMRWAQTARESEIKKMRARWSYETGYFGKGYLAAINYARNALEAKGAELPNP